MEITKQTKLIIVIIFFAICALCAYGVYSIVSNRDKGTVNFNIVPSEIMVSINNDEPKKIDQGQSLKLAKGEYELTATQDGYSENKSLIRIDAGSSQTVNIALDPLANTRSLSEEELIRGEGISSVQMDQDVDTINRNYPLIKILPVRRVLYTITPGPSQLFPRDQSKIAIYIGADSARARQDALDEIRQRGYDPSDYEIVFTGKAR